MPVELGVPIKQIELSPGSRKFEGKPGATRPHPRSRPTLTCEAELGSWLPSNLRLAQTLVQELEHILEVLGAILDALAIWQTAPELVIHIASVARLRAHPVGQGLDIA